MPRSARIDMPGLLQHVMVRGIEKRDIFADDKDRQSFLSRFSKLLQETSTDCLAWALLSNHFLWHVQGDVVKLLANFSLQSKMR